MTLLKAEKLVVGYGAKDVIIREVSLEVSKGELVSVIGPNGAGKSTLLKALAGVIPVRSGTIEVDGKDVTALLSTGRSSAGVAYVAQEANIFPTLSVLENLNVGGYIRSKQARKERIKDVLALLPNLESRLKEPAGRLSGGQRQMLAVGAALMANPSLALLDEPSAGLSPLATEELFKILLEVRRSGVAILMIEQNALEALEISDRAYVISLGENLKDGKASDIANDADIRKAFLGA